jgi:hypothetical protein
VAQNSNILLISTGNFTKLNLIAEFLFCAAPELNFDFVLLWKAIIWMNPELKWHRNKFVLLVDSWSKTYQRRVIKELFGSDPRTALEYEISYERTFLLVDGTKNACYPGCSEYENRW